METRDLRVDAVLSTLKKRIWQLFLYKSRSQFTRILCITSTPRWLQALSGLDTGTTSLSEKCSEGINTAKSLQYPCCSSVLDPLIGISKCNIEPLIVGFCQRGGYTASCRVSFRCRMAMSIPVFIWTFLPCPRPSWLVLALRGAGEPRTVLLSHVTTVNDPPI